MNDNTFSAMRCDSCGCPCIRLRFSIGINAIFVSIQKETFALIDIFVSKLDFMNIDLPEIFNYKFEKKKQVLKHC